MTIPEFSYDSQSEWRTTYRTAHTKQQSPINIDTSTILDSNNQKLCNQYCRLSSNYKPSNCYVFNKNNIPFVRFSPGSYIFYGGKKLPYHLIMMSLHTPSNHTINGSNYEDDNFSIKSGGDYDMEIILYHTLNPINHGDGTGKFNDITNASSTNDNNINGIAISILLKQGGTNSNAHSFLSQFMNQLPTDDTSEDTEIEIQVKEDWSPELLLPKDKKFFTYKGSLPFPPCHTNWQWIVFEEVQTIGKTLFKFFQLNYKNKNSYNNRYIQEIKSGTKVFYNNNPKLYQEDKKKIENIEKNMEHLIKQKKEYEQELDPVADNIQEDTPFNNEQELHSNKINKLNNNPVYKDSKVYIKSAIWGIILILVMACAIKIVKNFIHTNDYVASFALKRVQNTMNIKGTVSEDQNSLLEEIKKQIGLKRKLKETEKKIKEIKKYDVSKPQPQQPQQPKQQSNQDIRDT